MTIGLLKNMFIVDILDLHLFYIVRTCSQLHENQLHNIDLDLPQYGQSRLYVYEMNSMFFVTWSTVINNLTTILLRSTHKINVWVHICL